MTSVNGLILLKGDLDRKSLGKGFWVEVLEDRHQKYFALNHYEKNPPFLTQGF